MSALLPAPTAVVDALTTIWKPPCGTGVFSSSTVYAAGAALQSCYPPGWGVYWTDNLGYYSPAICPSGFEPGCTRYHTAQGAPVLPSETAWICVVSGFQCATSMASLATSGAKTMGVIQIRWKASDLSILETHPLTAGLRFGETSKTTSGSNPTRSGGGGGEDPGDYSGGGGGLSTGAKAGIGAGVAVAVLLLCIVAFFFIRRYRANRLDDGHHIQPAEEVQIEAVGGGGGGGGADGMRQFSDVNMSVSGEKPVVMPVNVELASHSVSAVPEIDSNPRQNLEPTELPVHETATSAPQGITAGWHNLQPEVAAPPPVPAPAPVQHENRAYSPTQSPISNDSTAAAMPPTAAELEALRARREALDVQRLRILRLQQIEDERAQVDQRISMLENRGSG